MTPLRKRALDAFGLAIEAIANPRRDSTNRFAETASVRLHVEEIGVGPVRVARIATSLADGVAVNAEYEECRDRFLSFRQLTVELSGTPNCAPRDAVVHPTIPVPGVHIFPLDEVLV